MLPFTKAKWFLGYSSLAIITEQDRRHWLLKTDRIKQVENSNDGNLFLGQINNQGSYIDISTKKLQYIHPVLKQYIPPNLKSVFELCGSALPVSYDVNGLCCARIVSSQYPYGENDNRNFKIVFDNCEEVYIPFPGESNIYGFNFIKTNSNPRLLMMDEFGNYTISIPINLILTNPTFYYPLDTFQPIDIINRGSGTYETIAIDNDSFIGYPGFWFTSDETITGPEFYSDSSIQKFNYGNLNNDPYNVQVFVMDKIYTNDYLIRVFPDEGTFNGTDYDYTIPLDLDRIQLVDLTGQSPVVTPIPITSSNGNKLFMWKNVGWIAKTGYYEIYLSNFNTNYSTPDVAMKPIFKLVLNNNIPFEKNTQDYGFAGLDITANTTENSYPYNLNQWDGLPEWITQNTDASQRLVVYAIHNTPNSSEENPNSRQTAALLFDPGVPITEVSEEPVLDNDNRGRIYLLSNDDAEYSNNAIATYPKPARTLARICDIPVSVAQLSNITGLAPNPIVDPDYVHSEASYTETEKKRLINTLANRWVRPIHKDSEGIRIIDKYDEDNPYVFQHGSTYLECVDLNNYNDFREYNQLNEMVHPNEVSLYAITDGGSGYQTWSIGIIIIGGFAFDYIVNAVDDTTGAVTELTISPSGTWDINISNFNMMPGNSGITEVYGTSPRESQEGTGLKVQLQIANYQEKIPVKGNIFPDLFALCRNSQGLWLYNYNTTTNKWEQSVCISEYEKTDEKDVSLKDAYINSILPNTYLFPVAPKGNDNDTSLEVIATSSFVNIVDTTKTPVYDLKSTSKKVVDINKFYCDKINTLTAYEGKTFNNVIKHIKNNEDRFDSYIIWRWLDENDPSNKQFEYGIVHRSFNNLQSFDKYKSNLPTNELYCKNYVHTNASTTLAWDLPDYNLTMIWAFNPKSHIQELYSIDANTRDLRVDRVKMKWQNITIYTNNYQTKLDMVDTSGKLLWNIATNSISATNTTTDRSPIYQQIDYVQYIIKGTYVANIPDEYQPIGNWQLIFPRIQNFTFKDSIGNTFNPMKMNVLRNPGIQENTVVYDSMENPVNYKTMVIDTTTENTTLKVYNSDTGKWESV